jgi:SAM-dependent methyltransferase
MSDERSTPLDQVRDLYSSNVAAKGVGPTSVGWRDEATQQLRFRKLAHVIVPESDTPLTYNDLGCGYGAMFPFLRDEVGAPLGAYRGYDISREMLDAARTFAADPRVELIEGARLDQHADYSFVSGTFNVRFSATDEDWLAYILEMLANAAELSKRGFAFNLLTTYVDWKEPNLYYGDPGFFFDHCVRKFSRRVALLQDYPLYEWTIAVRL